MEGRQTKQSTEKLWHIILMLQEASPCRGIDPGKPTTIIKVLRIIISCGAIEPCLFVASFLIIFPTAVSAVDSTFQRQIFLHNMESIRTISRNDI